MRLHERAESGRGEPDHHGLPSRDLPPERMVRIEQLVDEGVDPVLRLIFDREVKPSDKTVTFRMYLPGLNFPEREVEFRVKDLMFQGKLEM